MISSYDTHERAQLLCLQFHGHSFVAKAERRDPKGGPGKGPQLPPRGASKKPHKRSLTRPHGSSPSPGASPARHNPLERLLAKKLSPSYPRSSPLCSLVLRSTSPVSTSVGRLHAKGGLERRSREPSQPPLEPWHPLALFRSTSNILVTSVLALGGWPLTT